MCKLTLSYKNKITILSQKGYGFNYHWGYDWKRHYNETIVNVMDKDEVSCFKLWSNYGTLYLNIEFKIKIIQKNKSERLKLINHHVEKLFPFTTIHGGWKQMDGIPIHFRIMGKVISQYLFSTTTIYFRLSLYRTWPKYLPPPLNFPF